MGDLSKHFDRSEFKCKCGDCNYDTVDAELIELLEKVRINFREAVIITSGNRCPDYNRLVGGSKNSQHLYGRAADIVVANTTTLAVRNYLDAVLAGAGGLGYYPDSKFIHVDTRTEGGARWVG